MEFKIKNKEKIKKKINEFINELRKLRLNVYLGGSFAKDTYLEDDFDVDLFVQFPYEYKGKNISDILEKKLGKYKYERLKGSRDYFRVKKGKFNFEIVPVLEVREKAENITDYSLGHVAWVNQHVKDKNEVRKLKLFLKANKLYGAESYLQGFSGYACEILIAYYKDFNSLIKEACNWANRKIIDIQNHYKNEEEIIKKLNKEKINSLIIIDPIDKERNASSALSNENYKRFKELCRKYIKKPSNKYFEIKKFSIKDIKKGKNELLLFKKKITNKKRDGAKIMKIYNNIRNLLKDNDFNVVKSDFEVEDKISYIWFIIKKKKLSEKIKHYGPFVYDKENLEKFKKKWKDVKFEDNKSYVMVKRKFKNLDLIKRYIKKEFI